MRESLVQKRKRKARNACKKGRAARTHAMLRFPFISRLFSQDKSRENSEERCRNSERGHLSHVRHPVHERIDKRKKDDGEKR
jgi:hypothetical protein